MRVDRPSDLLRVLLGASDLQTYRAGNEGVPSAPEGAAVGVHSRIELTHDPATTFWQFSFKVRNNAIDFVESINRGEVPQFEEWLGSDIDFVGKCRNSAIAIEPPARAGTQLRAVAWHVGFACHEDACE